MKITHRILTVTLFSALLLFVFSLSSFAKPAAVNKFLLKQFQTQYRHASEVTWKSTGEYTCACFNLNGERTSVFYNSDNNLIGTSKDVNYDELPKAARRVITNKYGNAPLINLIEFTNADGDVNYYASLNNNGKTLILKCDESGSVSEFSK